MKKLVVTLFLFLMSSSVWATQCEVNVENEVKANDGWLMFHLDDGQEVQIDQDNQVYLEGLPLDLSPEQTQAVQQYREQVSHHFDDIKTYAQENAQFLSLLIDDIADSLGDPQAFDGLKQNLSQFWQEVSNEYIENGDVILPAGGMEALSQQWQHHFNRAKVLFDDEFLDQLWDAAATKLKQEDGFNLTAMGELMVDLEARISERLEDRSETLESQETNMCESLHHIVDKEADLRSQIPELQDYRVFTI